MSEQHTQEPWYVFSHYGDPEIRTKDGDKLVSAMLPSKIYDARRIVACVNACVGLETEMLIALVMDGTTLQNVMRRGLICLEQRDELLAALEDCRKQLSGWMRDHGDDIATQEAVSKARSAIASVKGGA